LIILDYSQVVISNLMAEIGGRRGEDIGLDVNLLRHMVINTIRSLKTKFEGSYGTLVIACDSKNYWRKKVFPYYKANRKKAREESGLDWPMIFDTINLIKEEIKTFFPYKVIEIETAEADDIIATLVMWSNENDVGHGLFPEPNPLLILSGDHDFIQLQKFKHVKQFSPITKKFITSDTTPEKYLFEHIIRGDKGDGIPNVLSGDTSIVDNERQKKIMQVKLDQWIADPSSMPQDEGFKRNFDRNKALVDLTKIPDDIKNNIINTFVNTPSRGRELLLDYFIKNKMKLMIEHIEEF
jgi:5'-3' exonuclease